MQGKLFDLSHPDMPGKTYARSDHPETSHEAAKDMKSSAATLRAMVLKQIRVSGNGLADEEGIALLKMNPSTYRPRRVELVERGLVKDSGRRTKTASGRSAIIWIAV